jgi:hypothetical protein
MKRMGRLMGWAKKVKRVELDEDARRHSDKAVRFMYRLKAVSGRAD